MLTAALHPVHLSVTDIFVADDSKDLSLAITFFMDDFGDDAGYSKHIDEINAGKMTVDDFILQHLEKHLIVKANGQKLNYEMVSKESNFPSVTCYLHFKKAPKDLSSLEVENTLLLDKFDDQKNMVNIRIPGKKEGTMILNRKKKKSSVTF